MAFTEIMAAANSAGAVDPDAQQRFHALEFAAPLGSRAMKLLTERFQPLGELGFAHVKRMKKHPTAPNTLVALAAPCADADVDVPTTEELAHALREAVEALQARLTSASALKYAPTSREAFERHTREWPLIFHASALPAALADPVGDDEVRIMIAHVRTAVALAKQFERENESAQPLPFCCAHGCVVVDPAAARVVSDSRARAAEPSLSFQPLFHPVMLGIDGVAERDRRCSAAASLRKRQRRVAGDADSAEQQQEESGAEGPAGEEETYLCTGYDVYVDREPCVMCAMALIHSRVRRVVFAELNATDGALASAHRLHTIKSLNHHYRVFHLSLECGDVAA
ncbi:hypothetical protein PybrP1_008721 [[Pythium] brassicae (nom. inval.)]|nr:hypothetical protein PybrP1_008721 [[Pythium] brassicae (nom. inval.)]